MMISQNNYENDLLDDIDNELSDQFTFDGFQVVRGEFFSHQREPSITFADCKIYANRACVNKITDADYVQILVNSETKKIAIKPCREDDKDSFIWRRYNEKNDCYLPKFITCRVFFAKVFELMNWNSNNRYKLLGKLINSGGEFLFIFDLTAAETFERISKDGEKPKRSRIPVFPAEWRNQFGMSFEEHKKQLQVNIFDGYAVFDVTKKENTKEDEPVWQDQQNQPSPSIL